MITTIERGGAELAVLALVKELVKKGERVVLIPIKGEKELLRDLIEVGVEVELTLLNRPFWRQLLLLINVIKLNRFDVLHAHLPRAELISRLALTFTKHVPFFITRHNAEPFLPTKNFLVSQLLSRWIVKRCHSVIAISNEVKDFLVENGEVTCLRKLTIIRYGYQRKFAKSTNQNENKLIPMTELQLVSIGRLVPQKNLTFAFRIVKSLKLSGVNVSLTIVGAGPLEYELRKFASDLDLKNNICFFGRTDDVFKVSEGKDAFLMTSNYEGFGLAVLEAIDYGLPVFAPNHSAFVEVLGVNNEGLYGANDLPEAVSKIRNFLVDKAFKSRLITTQHLRLAEFTIREYRELHLRLYQASKEVENANSTSS